jgi:hypothetical protein
MYRGWLWRLRDDKKWSQQKLTITIVLLVVTQFLAEDIVNYHIKISFLGFYIYQKWLLYTVQSTFHRNRPYHLQFLHS